MLYYFLHLECENDCNGVGVLDVETCKCDCVFVNANEEDCSGKLIMKLQSKILLAPLASYLSNQNQYVKINNF